MDAIIGFFQFIIDMVKSLISLVQSVISLFRAFTSFLPLPIQASFVVLIIVCVLYKVLGRENQS